MHAIVGNAASLGWVTLKALLLFLTAVFAFRLGERRTLAEMGAHDFVAAVAVGAIVGRVPNASTTSYLEGAATLITILAAHGAVTRLRYRPGLAHVFDHPPRLLVVRGKIDDAELRRSGLTHGDLNALLRTEGIQSVSELRYVVFEKRGSVSLIRETGQADGETVQALHRELERSEGSRQSAASPRRRAPLWH